MLERLKGAGADLAIDLGTSQIRIADRKGEILVEEPSVIALQAGRVVAVGEPARKMVGRTGSDTRAVRPVRQGRIEDFKAAELLLSALIDKATGRRLRNPRVLIGASSGLTEVEHRALQECVRAAGAREVYWVPSCLAAAAGAGLQVSEPIGNVIASCGAGHTEVAVISLGGLVVHDELRVGGEAMDEAIGRWTLSAHSLQLADRTCRHLKLQLGSADPRGTAVLRVRGRHPDQGTPKEIELSEEAVALALAPVLAQLTDLALGVLRRCPPELASDIVDRGLILCGGAAQLRGLDEHLRDAADLPVLLLDEPDRVVIRGCAALLDDNALFQRMTVRGT